MPMKMGWRWYGEGNDPVTLSDIKQIPGVTSIVWALHNKMPGEIWEIDEIQKVADQIHAYGFDMDVVESVNVHDDIKIGLPTRDQYIENYKQCIRNLSKFGVKVICYNFMPIFDWTRTDLFHPVGDGSTALFYEKDKIKGDYKSMAEYIMSFTEKYNMTFPGWEPERMAKLDELFKAYAPVTKEKLWENLKYFLEALMPTCRECDIKMAIHMDDPPWDIFGLPTRDQYIENYKQCIRNLSKFGVKVICYNFMPIFDWTRTDLFHPVGDGSTALFYEKDKIKGDYKSMAEYIMSFTEKYNMTFPGWEPERMAKLDELFKAYAPVTKEKLWENLKYFLEALMPTCRECDIKMAIHMDDPPWDIFGLPRLLVDAESIDRFLSMVDDEYNCLTLCSGSLNANPNNNVAEIVRKHCDRIAFAHIRNIHHFPNGDFSEAAHRDCCGETGIIEILRAYHDCGFEGYIRPDHGRQLWEEGPGSCRPGYGKYDRALGIQYMLGVWDLLDRLDEEKKKG